MSHDDKGVTSVSFLEGVDVRRPGRVADLLARAMRQRAVGATATNEHSSRSHMVFTLTITGTNAASGQQVHGELHCQFVAYILFLLSVMQSYCHTCLPPHYLVLRACRPLKTI